MPVGNTEVNSENDPTNGEEAANEDAKQPDTLEELKRQHNLKTADEVNEIVSGRINKEKSKQATLQQQIEDLKAMVDKNSTEQTDNTSAASLTPDQVKALIQDDRASRETERQQDEAKQKYQKYASKLQDLASKDDEFGKLISPTTNPRAADPNLDQVAFNLYYELGDKALPAIKEALKDDDFNAKLKNSTPAQQIALAMEKTMGSRTQNSDLDLIPDLKSDGEGANSADLSEYMNNF